MPFGAPPTPSFPGRRLYACYPPFRDLPNFEAGVDRPRFERFRIAARGLPAVDLKATFEPHRNCPLPFLQQSFREQREPVFMTQLRHWAPPKNFRSDQPPTSLPSSSLDG